MKMVYYRLVKNLKRMLFMENKKIKYILGATSISILIVTFYCMGQWLIPFVISLILAYALHVPAGVLSKKLKISTTLSAGIIVSALITGFTFFALFLIPLIKNASIVLIEKLPRLMESFPSTINAFLHKASSSFGIEKNFDISASFKNYIGQLASELPTHVLNFINTGMTVIYIVMFVFMIPIITFYLLKDWEKIEKSFSAILNKVCSGFVAEMLKNINNKLAEYMKGQILICCILSVFYTAALALIGTEEYIVCGLFSGFLSFAPFFGPFIGLLTALAMSIDDFSFTYQYVFTGCLYFVVPFIDSNFITPKLIGMKTGIQPFWLLFSVCATVSVLGIAGVFISVPMAVVLSTICKEIVKKL